MKENKNQQSKPKVKKSKKELSTKNNTEQKQPNSTNKNGYNVNDYELDFDNEVYDEVDIASALELGFIAKALEAHKSKVEPETHPDFDGSSCIDCGDDIPQLRLNLGKIRCVYCQEALEKKNKLYGR